MLKMFQNFWNCTTYRKKIVSRRKKENALKTYITKNLELMELKNANSNGCNIVINNPHPIILFFSKILRIELNEGLQSLF